MTEKMKAARNARLIAFARKHLWLRFWDHPLEKRERVFDSPDEVPAWVAAYGHKVDSEAMPELYA